MFFFGQSKIISLQCHFIFIVKISFLFAIVNFILSLGLFTTCRYVVKKLCEELLKIAQHILHQQLALSMFQKYRECMLFILRLCIKFENFFHIQKLKLTCIVDFYPPYLAFSYSFQPIFSHLLHFLLVPIYSYTSARKHSKAPYAYNCGR